MRATSRRNTGAALEEGYVDERLVSEQPKKRRRVGAASPVGFAVRVLMVVALCYLIGAQELFLACFTSVSCEPGVVTAGSNVTCSIRTSVLAAETDLSITQIGEAGPIRLLDSTQHAYVVSFSTAVAAPSGVRVAHSLLWRSSQVEGAPQAAQRSGPGAA